VNPAAKNANAAGNAVKKEANKFLPSFLRPRWVRHKTNVHNLFKVTWNGGMIVDMNETDSVQSRPIRWSAKGIELGPGTHHDLQAHCGAGNHQVCEVFIELEE